MNRGDVWWVDFGEPFGSEPGFTRPAIVISSHRFNRSRIRTVIVAAITSNLRLADAPGNVAIEAGVAGLPKACVVNVTQVVTVDRKRLLDRIGVMPAPQLSVIDDGLRLVLDLSANARQWAPWGSNPEPTD